MAELLFSRQAISDRYAGRTRYETRDAVDRAISGGGVLEADRQGRIDFSSPGRVAP